MRLWSFKYSCMTLTFKDLDTPNVGDHVEEVPHARGNMVDGRSMVFQEGSIQVMETSIYKPGHKRGWSLHKNKC